MASLDSFLQNGPVDGDRGAGLEELRKVVLLDGIPANGEGMVCQLCHSGIILP
jgi:cell cycle arrest protein BUB2